MTIRVIETDLPKRVAIIYQALLPPVIDGLRKDPKPGGYSDSGADIAFCLRQCGVHVVTPKDAPDPANALDWVFPDTMEGLRAATDAGANVIWANTVLFSGHPIEEFLSSHWIVGQLPKYQQVVDDKFVTNRRLYKYGLPVARSILVAGDESADAIALSSLSPSLLLAQGLEFPLVVKPIRGRGSQGVSLVSDWDSLNQAIDSLFESALFGNRVMVEQCLGGEELTITVLPGETLKIEGKGRRHPTVLPPVRRFNHASGIAPYNGEVAVITNSEALTAARCLTEPIRLIMSACADTFDQVGALAPIRVDCRADDDGIYRIFDVNMKPNMTGAGRPGRADQDSLSAIAARALNWSYTYLLVRMLHSAWQIE